MAKEFPEINKSLRQFYDSALSHEDEDEEASVISELADDSPRYSSETVIGEGAVKQILLSQDELMDRHVAKGIIKGDCNHQQLEHFIDEIKITAKLDHPNIIPVYDMGLTGDRKPYFTMKFIDGSSLQDILDKRGNGCEESINQYNLNRMLEIFLKVCDAVSFAHSKSIIHLDIKPANIQIGTYGEVLLCDWGLAKVIGQADEAEPESKSSDIPPGSNNTMQGLIKGSPGYMAPEQAGLTGHHKTALTDIYSLGALLYAMIIGQPPVKGDSLDDLIENTRTGNITPINTHNTVINPGLESIVYKALALKPEDRYQSVKQLSSDLRAYQDGYAPQAENAGLVKQAQLLVKRHRSISLLMTLFLLITLILSAIFINKINNEKAQLLAEKEQTRQARIKASEFIINNAIHNYYKRHFDRTHHLGEQAVNLDPNNNEAWEYLGYFYLGSLESDKAFKALKNTSGDRADWLTKKTALLHDLQKDGTTSVVDAIEFRNIMRTADATYRKAVAHHINFTVTTTYSLEERIRYAERSLSEGSKTPIKLQPLDNNAYLLNLSHHKKLNPSIPVIMNLPIQEIDLSHSALKTLDSFKYVNGLQKLDISFTAVQSLQGLNKTNIRDLNISGSKVTSLNHLPSAIETLELGTERVSLSILHQFKMLKKLIIPRNIYNQNQLKKAIEQNIEIVYKD